MKATPAEAFIAGFKRGVKGEMVCIDCATVATPKQTMKGSFVIELFLWLCFIVPGLLYSLWRLTTKGKGCPRCGGKMIPTDSPAAKKIIGATD